MKIFDEDNMVKFEVAYTTTEETGRFSFWGYSDGDGVSLDSDEDIERMIQERGASGDIVNWSFVY